MQKMVRHQSPFSSSLFRAPFISNAPLFGMGPHARNIVLWTCVFRKLQRSSQCSTRWHSLHCVPMSPSLVPQRSCAGRGWSATPRRPLTRTPSSLTRASSPGGPGSSASICQRRRSSTVRRTFLLCLPLISSYPRSLSLISGSFFRNQFPFLRSVAFVLLDHGLVLSFSSPFF